MIEPFFLLLSAYFLINGLHIHQKKEIPAYKLKSGSKYKWIKDSLWIKYPWVSSALFYFLLATGLLALFNNVNAVIVFAAFVTAGAQCSVNIAWQKWQTKFKVTLFYYIAYHAIQLSLIYIVLILFNRIGSPQWLLNQIYLFLFSKSLQIDANLILPGILLILILVTFTASDIIATFLNKYGNPVAINQKETAAALESMSEDINLKKQYFQNGIRSEISVEEEMGVLFERGQEDQKKITESIKIQYHIQQEEDDISKGKYIGILERLLICVFVVYGIYHGLLLLGAMKTLARFKLFENKAFAEYYLMGTLISLIIAIICGFFMQRLLNV